jgi:tetratricopeptide (TPR) repeat protein
VVGDPLRALRACERVFEVEPSAPSAPTVGDAMRTAVRLCRAHDLWDELIAFFERLVDCAATDRARGELLLKLAKVYDEGLDDQEKAFATLQTAFEVDVTCDVVAEALEGHARLRGKLDELLTFYVTLLDGVVDDDARVSLCTRLGQWYIDLGHLDHAAPFYAQALKVRPDHWPALEALAAIDRRQGRWKPLSGTLARMAAIAARPDERRDVHVALGELFEEKIGDLSAAAASYRDALAIDPFHVVATKGLARTSQSEEDWRALVAALERQRATMRDPKHEVALLRDLARIHLEELEDVPAAIATLRAVVVLAPNDSRSLEDLDDLLSREERWEELVDVLDTLSVEVTSDRRRVDILLRLASVLDECLSRQEEALEWLEALLAIEPSHEAALGALGRIYRDLERWDDLVRIYRHQLDVAEDPDLCVDIYHELGRLYLDRLDDPREAIAAWERSRRLEDDNVDVLEGLADAYERVEQWPLARQILERLLEVVDDRDRRTACLHRLAALLAGPLGDATAAVERLEQALAIDPGHRPSLVLLKDLRQEREEWAEAVRLIEKLLDVTEEPALRSRLLSELGVIHDVRFKDPSRAKEQLLRALEHDPDNLSAVGHLAELHVEAKQYGAALPLLAKLLRKESLAQLDEPTKHRVYFLRGYTAHVLGQDVKALESYRSAAAIDPFDLQTLRGLAALHTKRGEWNEAYQSSAAILEHHRDAIPTDEVIEVLHRLGVAARNLGDIDKAVEMLEKVLELEPLHAPSLEALVDIHEKEGDWRRTLAHKRKLLLTLPEPDRIASLVEAATIASQKLKDPEQAIECLEAAHALQPESIGLLRKLVELYTAVRRWADVIAAVEKIIALQTDGARIAVCHRTIASLYRNELREPGLAVQHFEKCLDHDLSRREAFEAIETILTEGERWSELAASYHRMLDRIRGRDERALESRLWRTLGELHTRLGELERAAEAYEAMSRLEPENIEWHAKLADLYSEIPGATDKAIAQHRHLIEEDPLWVTSYRALASLYLRTERYDEAWCLCATLCFLGQADEEQRRFYEANKDQSLPRRPGVVSEEAWREDLVVPGEHARVGAIFEVILPTVRRLRVQPLSMVGLWDHDRFDPATSGDPMGALFVWTALTMGLQPPALYLMSRQGTSLLFAPTDPPASIADVMLLSMDSPDEARFEMGRHLASYRTDHYIRCLEPTLDGLRDLFLSAIRAVRPDANVPGDLADVAGSAAGVLRASLTRRRARRVERAARRRRLVARRRADRVPCGLPPLGRHRRCHAVAAPQPTGRARSVAEGADETARGLQHLRGPLQAPPHRRILHGAPHMTGSGRPGQVGTPCLARSASSSVLTVSHSS